MFSTWIVFIVHKCWKVVWWRMTRTLNFENTTVSVTWCGSLHSHMFWTRENTLTVPPVWTMIRGMICLSRDTNMKPYKTERNDFSIAVIDGSLYEHVSFFFFSPHFAACQAGFNLFEGSCFEAIECLNGGVTMDDLNFCICPPFFGGSSCQTSKYICYGNYTKKMHSEER